MQEPTTQGRREAGSPENTPSTTSSPASDTGTSSSRSGRRAIFFMLLWFGVPLLILIIYQVFFSPVK